MELEKRRAALLVAAFDAMDKETAWDWRNFPAMEPKRVMTSECAGQVIREGQKIVRKKYRGRSLKDMTK